MDREKAIETLKWLKGKCANKKVYSDLAEALDLAIEALEREIEYGQMVVGFTKGETMKSDEWKYDTTCNAETATTTDCNDCIWNTCNYNKIDWEASEDCISRQDAIEEIKNATTIKGWNKYASQEEIVDDVEKQLRRLFVGAIESLPPVTPTERTGEWIVSAEGDSFCETCLHSGECDWEPWQDCNYEPKTEPQTKCGTKMKGGTENDRDK